MLRWDPGTLAEFDAPSLDCWDAPTESEFFHDSNAGDGNDITGILYKKKWG